MKSRTKKWKTYISLGMACILLNSYTMRTDAEEYLTYSRLIAGGGTNVPAGEEEYTVIAVSTEADLMELADNCQLDSWSRDKYVKLENDISLRENPNLTIPTFGGIFDGGGYEISNLDITASGSALGLFRYVQESGVVKNLSVSGRVCPQGSRSRVGFLAGVNYGKILNCTVSGRVEGAEEIGGIAGVNESTGEIRLCQSSAIVTGDHCTGGICGRNNGTLNNCKNTGHINTYSMDVTYSLEDITIENLEDLSSSENVAAHTDTGGIAGYSQGKIYYCTNTGMIGYQHVGYNTGGIVGRLHQGYLQNCTNTGRVLGRKDVGGIAGQMEPFLEIQYINDKLSEIDREANAFLDLLEATQDELSSRGKEAADLTKEISAHLKNASEASGNLTGTVNELWYIYNQELGGIGSDFSRLSQELGDLVTTDREEPGAGNPAGGAGTDADTPAGGAGTDADTPAGGDGTTIPDIPWDNGIQLDLESYFAAIRRFGESTGGHLTNMTNAANDRNGGVTQNLEVLNAELDAAGRSLQQLAQVLEKGTDKTSANIDALIAQGRTLRKSISELRNDLFRYEGITVADTSDEEAAGEPGQPGAENGDGEAYYDTSTFQQGKITLCVNRGTVEADTSVGGIVGQVATEYDFDPEDDISVSGTESFSIEQTVKAVVRESQNLGDVTGKKDYVGGIAGRADFGAVISCESYGAVSSTGGDYVGGVVGSSGYCIRDCYFMGAVSGKNYVGGIAGRGSDIFYSGAYPEVERSGEFAGAIAGKLAEDGMLCRNYYVQNPPSGEADGRTESTPGVDSIGYDGGAEPLAYGEFCAVLDVPGAFKEFTVTFQAEGQELASFQCRYGDAIEPEGIPEIPEKEGYYGVWPDFDYNCVTGNRVLEAQYVKWISSLASEEKDESGRAKVLVQGEFLPGTHLMLEEREEGTAISFVRETEEGTAPVEYKAPLVVRVLCEGTDAAAAEIWENGSYTPVAAETIGSYVEFPLEKEERIFRVTAQGDENGFGLRIAAAAGTVAIVLLLWVVGKRFRRKKAPRHRK